MTINAIRELHEARPFRPFSLIAPDGTRLHVPHPEFLAHPGKGRTVVLFDQSGAFHVIDLLLISHAEVGAPGNGRGRRGRN